MTETNQVLEILDQSPASNSQPLRFIALIIAYDGAPFYGSQRQNNGPSVQGEIERVLELVLKQPTPISLAGRTDAGVHATGQVAHVSNPFVPDLVAEE